MSKPTPITSKVLTREEQESLCIRMLYNRACNAFPGLELEDIQKVVLRDGTALFAVSKVGLCTATVAIRKEICFIGMRHWEDPQLDISIHAPWAFIALTNDAMMVTHVACLRPLIAQAIKEELESQIRGYCVSA